MSARVDCFFTPETTMKQKIVGLIDKFESYFCRFLLCFFVTLLFVQVIFRVIILESLSWSEELSRFAFVWFAYLGASYAARLGAHNRVTIQFKLLPKLVKNIILLIADGIWILFNVVMIRESLKVIYDMIDFPFFSPALNWAMHYVYLIFPLAFGLMIIRIIQVNVLKFVYGIELSDVDDATAELKEKTEETQEKGWEVSS
jgi:C4-dicarboxylate transporter, DctQ subunit